MKTNIAAAIDATNPIVCMFALERSKITSVVARAMAPTAKKAIHAQYGRNSFRVAPQPVQVV
jgi:hypothetical protein